MLPVASVLAVACVSAFAHLIGIFFHVDDGMMVEYLVRHRHRYCQSVLLVLHRHSVISISPMSQIKENSVIAQLWL